MHHFQTVIAPWAKENRLAGMSGQNDPQMRTGIGKVDSGMSANLENEWLNVLEKLRIEFGDAAFKSWLERLSVVAVDGGEAALAVPTKFIRDWIVKNYADSILAFWQQENPAIGAIEFVVVPGVGAALSVGAAVEARPELRDDAEEAEPEAASARVRGPQPVRKSVARVQSAEPDLTEQFDTSGLDPRCTFDNFVVGKPNEFAHAAARRVAESESVPFNPLFLYGGVGLGKTHLMHAIAWQISKRATKRKVLYLSAEQFMYRFIRALRFKDTMAFKEQFRSVDVLMIDDIQFICGNKDSTQEEFFHTFNALVDQNRQIVISADKSPSDLEGMEERLRSRLGWGLVADIHPTTYELRLGILHAKAESYRVDVPTKVMEFLAHKITSNVRELEGALNRIVAHADLVKRPITIETTQDLLRDLLRAHDRRVTIDEIQRKVAEHYNMRVADMHSDRRARTVARPRQVAMFLAKQLTQRSLPEIGRKFGGRDHTTVIHAVKKVEELMAVDPSFAEDIELLRRTLGG
jgi:chromosomal replication initiator protein